jgi:copper(I)-binding protein
LAAAFSRKNLMRLLAILACASFVLSGCGPKASEKPAVRDATVRLAAVADRPAAGYFTLQGGRSDDRLLRIDSAVVNKIELHQVGTSGGMMTMRPMADVPLPAGVTVKFAPGGNHAMLFGIDKHITPGTGIPMLFTFQSGAKIEVEAKTVAAGDDMGGVQH